MPETFEQLEEAIKDLAVCIEREPTIITKWDLMFKIRFPDYSPVIRSVFTFKNGRSISVVRGYGTYGHLEGLFEVAILNKDGLLDYSTNITKDVIGYCDIKAVVDIAKTVMDLPDD